jgi:hypothetical protein
LFVEQVAFGWNTEQSAADPSCTLHFDSAVPDVLQLEPFACAEQLPAAP